MFNYRSLLLFYPLLLALPLSCRSADEASETQTAFIADLARECTLGADICNNEVVVQLGNVFSEVDKATLHDYSAMAEEAGGPAGYDKVSETLIDDLMLKNLTLAAQVGEYQTYFKAEIAKLDAFANGKTSLEKFLKDEINDAIAIIRAAKEGNYSEDDNLEAKIAGYSMAGYYASGKSSPIQSINILALQEAGEDLVKKILSKGGDYAPDKAEELKAVLAKTISCLNETADYGAQASCLKPYYKKGDAAAFALNNDCDSPLGAFGDTDYSNKCNEDEKATPAGAIGMGAATGIGSTLVVGNVAAPALAGIGLVALGSNAVMGAGCSSSGSQTALALTNNPYDNPVLREKKAQFCQHQRKKNSILFRGEGGGFGDFNRAHEESQKSWQAYQSARKEAEVEHIRNNGGFCITVWFCPFRSKRSTSSTALR